MLDDDGCVICCAQECTSSFSDANSKNLCRLLGLTSSLPSEASTSRSDYSPKTFPDLLVAGKYCDSCSQSVSEIGNLYYALEEIEEKLEVSRSNIVEQLLRSAAANQQFLPDLEVNDNSHYVIRAKIVSELIDSRTNSANQFGKWIPDRAPLAVSITESGHQNQTANHEHILPDFIVTNLPAPEDDWPPCPLSPATSNQSFEEKFEPMPEDSVEEAYTYNTDMNVISTTTRYQNRKDSEPSNLDLEECNATKKSRKLASGRVAICPFEPSCGRSISRSDEASKNAHFLRYHKGIRNCYVCKTCGKGFTGLQNLQLHESNHCSQNQTASNSVSRMKDDHLSGPAPSRPVVELSQKTKSTSSPFPIVVLSRLKDERVSPSHINSNEISRSSISNRGDTTGSFETETPTLILMPRPKSRRKVVKRKLSDTESSEEDIDELKKKRTRKIAKPSNVQKETRTASLPRSLKCPFNGCTMGFRLGDEHRRQAHYRKVHEGIRDCYLCEVCNVSFRYLVDWKKHNETHTGVPAFLCKYCNLDCKGGRTLRTHIMRVHELHKAKHKCPICEKAFLNKAHLDYHVRYHNKERPFMCEICSETFTTSQYLKYHQSKHVDSNVQPYKCKLCNKQLGCPRSLRSHVKRIHTKTYTVKCDFCDYGAQSKSELARHVLHNHTTEKDFICHLCPAAFKDASNLKLHVQRHNGERKFKCKYCGTGFTMKGYLRRHELIHTNEQCHECQICGKKFPVRNYLYIHMRSHNKTNSKTNSASKKNTITTTTSASSSNNEESPPNVSETATKIPLSMDSTREVPLFESYVIGMLN